MGYIRLHDSSGGNGPLTAPISAFLGILYGIWKKLIRKTCGLLHQGLMSLERIEL